MNFNLFTINPKKTKHQNFIFTCMNRLNRVTARLAQQYGV